MRKGRFIHSSVRRSARCAPRCAREHSCSVGESNPEQLDQKSRSDASTEHSILDSIVCVLVERQGLGTHWATRGNGANIREQCRKLTDDLDAVVLPHTDARIRGACEINNKYNVVVGAVQRRFSVQSRLSAFAMQGNAWQQSSPAFRQVYFGPALVIRLTQVDSDGMPVNLASRFRCCCHIAVSLKKFE